MIILIQQKIFGVSMHQKYGGWFGMRGIITFTNITVPQLQKKPLENFLNNEQVGEDNTNLEKVFKTYFKDNNN